MEVFIVNSTQIWNHMLKLKQSDAMRLKIEGLYHTVRLLESQIKTFEAEVEANRKWVFQ